MHINIKIPHYTNKDRPFLPKKSDSTFQTNQKLCYTFWYKQLTTLYLSFKTTDTSCIIWTGSGSKGKKANKRGATLSPVPKTLFSHVIRHAIIDLRSPGFPIVQVKYYEPSWTIFFISLNQSIKVTNLTIV